MKTFSAAKKLSPATARNCFLMNQFATPGLGSLMGGRILPGLGQLLLALAGFVFVMLWFVRLMKEYYNVPYDEGAVAPTVSFKGYFLSGAFLFAASWLWSLLTSLSLMRDAKAPEPMPPGSTPPQITNQPPKM
jgi:hypothetical protein